MKEKLIIVGISSTARHVYDFVQGYHLYEILGFAVDEQYRTSDRFCDLPVYSLETLDDVFDKTEIKIFVAILWNRLNSDRKYLYERLKAQGYQFANLISPSAVIRGKLLGDNCWVHDYVVIQSQVEIGEDTMLMAFSLVGDYAQVGRHCFLGAKSTVAGKSLIGDQTFIGINCTVFDGTKVGKKCILGACTVVKRNVDDFSVVKTDTKSMIVVSCEEKNIESKLMFEKNER